MRCVRRLAPTAPAQANVSALPEVAGDAALYFDPYRPQEIAEAVCRLLAERDFAASLVAKAFERQRHFTWRRAAVETLDSYERARARA